MRKLLADWRTFQDTIVWNPLCRYTILPAGIVVAMWLVAGSIWYRDGELFYCSKEIDLAGLAAFAMALLLTGRWMPTLIGFIFAMPAAAETFWNRGVDLAAIGWPLLAFGVVAFWLISQDCRRLANRQPLPRWMTWMARASAGFMILILLLAVAMQNFTILSATLLGVSAAFWSTVFFDLVWRLSHGWHARTLHGLINAAVLWAIVLNLYVNILRINDPFIPGLVIGALSITICQFWSHRAADRDAGRREDTPASQQKD